MKDSYERLLRRMAELAEQGHLGENALEASLSYAELPNDLARCAKFVREFFDADVDDEMRFPRSYFCQLVLVAYRDAKKQDATLAQTFALALIEDFPGAPGSALLPRWCSLAEASFAFQHVAFSIEPSLVWQQASRLVLAINEFLDGLIGLLIIAWRCAQAKTVNVNVLGNAYGSKIDEFTKLTDGDDGAFYLFLRIADADLRNGIAHGSMWLDADERKVRYVVGRQTKTDRTMDLEEFMCIAMLGSHLGAALCCSTGNNRRA